MGEEDDMVEEIEKSAEAPKQTSRPDELPTILKWSRAGKRVIAGVLIVLMFGVVILVMLEILYQVANAVLGGTLPHLSAFLTEEGMLTVLGTFLSVLIALELIETVEVYFRSHSIHVEIVVLVAIIALARKVVLLDLAKDAPLVPIGIGFVILVLGVTYYLVRKASPDT